MAKRKADQTGEDAEEVPEATKARSLRPRAPPAPAPVKKATPRRKPAPKSAPTAPTVDKPARKARGRQAAPPAETEPPALQKAPVQQVQSDSSQGDDDEAQHESEDDMDVDFVPEADGVNTGNSQLPLPDFSRALSPSHHQPTPPPGPSAQHPAGTQVINHADVTFGLKRKQTPGHRKALLNKLTHINSQRDLALGGSPGASPAPTAPPTPRTPTAQLFPVPTPTPTAPPPPPAGNNSAGFVPSPGQTPHSNLSSSSNNPPPPGQPTPPIPAPTATPASPERNAAVPQHQQGSYAGGTALFVLRMKSYFHIKLMLEDAFPSDEPADPMNGGVSMSDSLILAAYTKAYADSPFKYKYIVDFRKTLRDSISSFRGSFKRNVASIILDTYGLSALALTERIAQASRVKEKSRFLYPRLIPKDPKDPNPDQELKPDGTPFSHPAIIAVIKLILRARTLTSHGAIFNLFPNLFVDGIPPPLYAFAATLIRHSFEILVTGLKVELSGKKYASIYSDLRTFATTSFTMQADPAKAAVMRQLRASHMAAIRSSVGTADPDAPDFGDF
ncbi:hypothetical protein AURDEDRAFT_177398 [Auricularia subglabra TFB-10046 SS5]|uniref:DUF6532 domain-containing protein n=1 Tax=Auricularia subglabra (strain TFB-10046 / SS5) TaxID=717982 RepID=J0CTA0_AURST|nr:hypothetical protein AURDEDRAFT_177398 [Auricularia subglabra TFB-10046 SS5]